MFGEKLHVLGESCMWWWSCWDSYQSGVALTCGRVPFKRQTLHSTWNHLFCVFSPVDPALPNNTTHSLLALPWQMTKCTSTKRTHINPKPSRFSHSLMLFYATPWEIVSFKIKGVQLAVHLRCDKATGQNNATTRNLHSLEVSLKLNNFSNFVGAIIPEQLLPKTTPKRM